VPHPAVGQMKLVASPMHLSKTPVDIRMPPPILGQHTREILQKALQMDANEIETLHRKGVV